MSDAGPIDSCPATTVTNLQECNRVTANSTEGGPLYSNSGLFRATTTPKDVKAFKFYCTVNLIMSLIEEMVCNVVFYSKYYVVQIFSDHVLHLKKHNHFILFIPLQTINTTNYYCCIHYTTCIIAIAIALLTSNVQPCSY